MGAGGHSLINRGGPRGGGEGVSLLQAAVWGSGQRPGSGPAVPHSAGEAGPAPRGLLRLGNQESERGWGPKGSISLQEGWHGGGGRGGEGVRLQHIDNIDD